jgi:hypothetical protein
MIEVCDTIVDVAPFIDFLCILIDLKVLIKVVAVHIARTGEVSKPSLGAWPLKLKV